MGGAALTSRTAPVVMPTLSETRLGAWSCPACLTLASGECHTCRSAVNGRATIAPHVRESRRSVAPVGARRGSRAPRRRLAVASIGASGAASITPGARSVYRCSRRATAGQAPIRQCSRACSRTPRRDQGPARLSDRTDPGGCPAARRVCRRRGGPCDRTWQAPCRLVASLMSTLYRENWTGPRVKHSDGCRLEKPTAGRQRDDVNCGYIGSGTFHAMRLRNPPELERVTTRGTPWRRQRTAPALFCLPLAEAKHVSAVPNHSPSNASPSGKKTHCVFWRCSTPASLQSRDASRSTSRANSSSPSTSSPASFAPCSCISRSASSWRRRSRCRS